MIKTENTSEGYISLVEELLAERYGSQIVGMRQNQNWLAGVKVLTKIAVETVNKKATKKLERSKDFKSDRNLSDLQ